MIISCVWLIFLEPVRPRLLASYSVLYTTIICQEAPAMLPIAYQIKLVDLLSRGAIVSFEDILLETANRCSRVFRMKTSMDLKLFHKSDTAVLWMNFCFETSKNNFF